MTSNIFLIIALVIIFFLLMAFTILVKQVREEGRMYDLARIDLMRDIRDLKMQSYLTNANVKAMRNALSGHINSSRRSVLDSSRPSVGKNSRDRRRQRRAAERARQQS